MSAFSAHPEGAERPRRRWPLVVAIAAWALVLAVAVPLSLRLADVTRDETPEVPGSESALAQQLLRTAFRPAADPNNEVKDVILVLQDGRRQVKEAAFADAAGSLLGQAAGLPGVRQITSYWSTENPALIGRDGRSTYALVEVEGTRRFIRQEFITQLRDLRKTLPAGLHMYVTGDAAVGKDLGAAGKETVRRAERIVIPTVLIVLIVVFRSLWAALLPLGLGLISVTVAKAVMYLYALKYPAFNLAGTMISMIGMGVGVDYALFMVSRFREELAGSGDRRSAAAHTVATSGQAILFSGITVLISVSSLFLVRNPVIQTMGISMALVVAIAVTVSLTLLPPFLVLLGPRLFALALPASGRRAPRSSGEAEAPRRLWYAWAMAIMQRPWRYAFLAIIPLLLASAPIWQIRTGWPNLSQLPATADARQGFAVLQEQFAAGLAGRVEIVAEMKSGNVGQSDNIRRLYRMAAAVQADPMVDSVLSLASFQPGWDAEAYVQLFTAGQTKLAEAMRQVDQGTAGLGKAAATLTQIQTGLGEAGKKLASMGTAALTTAGDMAQMAARLGAAPDALCQVADQLDAGAGELQTLAGALTMVGSLVDQSATQLTAASAEIKGDARLNAALSSLKRAQSILKGSLFGIDLASSVTDGADELGRGAGILRQIAGELASAAAWPPTGKSSGAAGMTEADIQKMTASLHTATAGIAQVAAGLRQTAAQVEPIAGAIDLQQLQAAMAGSDLSLRLAAAGAGAQYGDMLPTLVNLERGATFTRLVVVPKAGPDSAATEALVARLRSDILPAVSAGLAGVWVGGTPALIYDFNAQISKAVPRVIVLVLLITFLILLLLLRSVILPLKAIVMNVLSVMAAYGLLVLVFQKGYFSGMLRFQSLGFVESPVILVLFAILFGLSMDYEVFMLTRIKEAYSACGDNMESVAGGLEKTAGVITGAAVIMVVVFGAFVATGVMTAKEFGFGLAAAVLLDAALIRIVLVPAFMRLAGHWNWWLPGWLDRLLPKIGARH